MMPDELLHLLSLHLLHVSENSIRKIFSRLLKNRQTTELFEILKRDFEC